MLMDVIRILADGGSDSTATALTVAVISGCATILVAVIGLISTRDRRQRNSMGNTERNMSEVLIDDLRARNEGLLDSVRKRDIEIDRLERVCLANGINPHNGHPIGGHDE